MPHQDKLTGAGRHAFQRLLGPLGVLHRPPFRPRGHPEGPAADEMRDWQQRDVAVWLQQRAVGGAGWGFGECDSAQFGFFQVATVPRLLTSGRRWEAVSLCCLA